MTRLTFLLRQPGERSRHEQYAELTRWLTPLLQASGVYQPASWIANPCDFRAAIFWNVAPRYLASMIELDVERYLNGMVETQMWGTSAREYRDHLGRCTWEVRPTRLA